MDRTGQEKNSKTSAYLSVSKLTILQIVVLEASNTGVCIVESVLTYAVWEAVLQNQKNSHDKKTLLSGNQEGVECEGEKHLQPILGRLWGSKDL